MKRVVPKESQFDAQGFSARDSQPEVSGGHRRVQTSAAMLGLALSFGASAPLLTEPEIALAADGSNLTVLPITGQKTAQEPKIASTRMVGSSEYHTVEPGESLWKIAAHHSTDIQAIKDANGIASDEILRVGQVIRVPAVGMAGLANTSESGRLALKTGIAGGVGGDMLTADADSLAAGVPLVDDLEKVWELEASLTDEETFTDEQFADEQLDEEQISHTLVASAAAEQSAQDELAQVATLPVNSAQPNAVQPTAEQASADIAMANSQPVAPATAESNGEYTPVASLPLFSEGERPVEEAAQSSPSEALSTNGPKKDLVAVLPPRAEIRQPQTDPTTLRSYRVKPGDTLWSIASRNGLTLDELLSHNREVNRPTTLAVGDSINLPGTSTELASADVSESVAMTTSDAVPARTREQVISDHLARIRESNSNLIDRDELNARIREARQELERSRTETSGSTVSLEYHSPEPVAVSPAGGEGNELANQVSPSVRSATQTEAAQWTVTDVAQAAPQQVAVITSEAETAIDSPESTNAVAAPNQLLAAAPLGADAYSISPSLPVGQTVSPNMPMMPGASEFLPEAPALSNGYIWPARGTLTSGYGWRWGRMHRGVDIAAPVGTPVVAAADGVVVRSGWNSGGYGNLVDIRHADGSMTRYGHNSRLLVREGQQVRQGQQIADMGSTGYSTGPHVHFEVHLPNSGTVNPMAYLPDR